MTNSLDRTHEFLPAAAFIDEPRILPGLYPWLQFGHSRDDWVELFGFNLDVIEYKAANAYLTGESGFFEAFLGKYVSIIGRDQAMAITQPKLENTRCHFIHAATHLCGSPIEQLMLAGMMWRRYGYERKLVEIWDTAADPVMPRADVVIAPQYHTETYRADFAMFVNFFANEEIKILVECDGHKFHEKTKEQAARDKGRDNDLQIAGWKVLRFSGSMIWQDHEWCTDCVAELVRKEIEAQLRRRGILR